MSGATVVMQGSLSVVRLFDILQGVGISRQHTLIELRHQQRVAQGAIFVLNDDDAETRGRVRQFLNKRAKEIS